MAEEKSLPLAVSSSPHVLGRGSVRRIMIDVLISLLPAVAYSIVRFGVRAAVMYAAAVATCLAAEALSVRLRRRPFSLGDLSAVVTGMLLVMTLPPGFPIYGVVLGAAVAVVIGKQIFGGLGHNIFNPALVGRAFLAATYPVFISDFPRAADAVTGATPLAAAKFDGAFTPLRDLFLGTVGGSVGETSALLLLAGALYLFARGWMKWRIPLAIGVTVAVLGQFFHLLAPQRYPDAPHHLLAGGLLLGAVYMATDPATSPLGPLGGVIFGAGIGAMVVVIRLFGGLPEGVMYAVLFMNAVVPLIDRAARPRLLGARGRAGGGGRP